MAHRLHDLGNTVIVAGRRLDVLKQAIAGRTNMHEIELDVSTPDGIADFARTVQRLRTHDPCVVEQHIDRRIRLYQPLREVGDTVRC